MEVLDEGAGGEGAGDAGDEVGGRGGAHGGGEVGGGVSSPSDSMRRKGGGVRGAISRPYAVVCLKRDGRMSFKFVILRGCLVDA